MGARSRGDDKRAIGDGSVEAVVDFGAVEDAVGAGRHHARLVVRPGRLWRHQAQARQTEIGHGARTGSDVLGELRFDQHDDRAWRRQPTLGLVGSGTGHSASNAPLSRLRRGVPGGGRRYLARWPRQMFLSARHSVKPGGHEFEKRTTPHQPDEIYSLSGKDHTGGSSGHGFGKRGVVHPAVRCCHGRPRRLSDRGAGLDARRMTPDAHRRRNYAVLPEPASGAYCALSPPVRECYTARAEPPVSRIPGWRPPRQEQFIEGSKGAIPRPCRCSVSAAPQARRS